MSEWLAFVLSATETGLLLAAGMQLERGNAGWMLALLAMSAIPGATYIRIRIDNARKQRAAHAIATGPGCCECCNLRDPNPDVHALGCNCVSLRWRAGLSSLRPDDE